MTFADNIKLGYDLGFSYVALNGKIPTQPGWTTAPRMSLDDALKQAAVGNVGVRCGSASAPDSKYLLVIDQDTEIGIDLPLTLMIKTKSGYHHYYYTDQPLGNSTGKLAPQYDTRGEGGQVVYAGSRHPGNGHIYDWATSPDTPIADLPASLVRKLTSTKPRPAAPTPTHYLAGSKLANAIVRSECERITTAATGERNNALNTAAFKIGKHIAAGIIERDYAVQELTNAAITAGLGRSETKATIESGMAGGAAAPRRNAPAEPEATPEEVFAEPPVALADPIPDTTEFPVEVLPPWLAEMTQGIATHTETPLAMAGCVALGMLGTVSQKQYQVEVEDGYTESLSIWPCVAMKTGQRKSAVINAMIKPIVDYEAKQHKELTPEVNRNISKNKSIDKKIDKLRTSQSSKDGAAWEVDQSIIDDYESKKETECLSLPSYWCQDITPESLANQMSLNQERMGMFSDEGGIFKTLAGRYNNNIENIDLMLQSYTGTPIKINRKSSEPLNMLAPAISVCLTLQPVVLRRIADNESFRECGLLARFLFCLPKSLVGRRTGREPRVPRDVRTAYADHVTQLMDVKLPETPRTITLSEPAYACLDAFRQIIEPQLEDGAELSAMYGWAHKLVGTAARLAGLLHVSIEAQPEAVPVSDYTMANAIRLSQYFLDQAQITFGMMEKDEDTALSEYVIDWIKRQCVEEFSFRECWRGLKGKIKNADRLRMILDSLQDNGYVAKGETKNNRGKPTITYQVHPEL